MMGLCSGISTTAVPSFTLAKLATPEVAVAFADIAQDLEPDSGIPLGPVALDPRAFILVAADRHRDHGLAE